MAKVKRRLFFATADTTPEDVFTNVSGQITELKSMTMAAPTGALTTNIRLAIGTDGATTRVIEYVIPAGAGTYIVYPGIVLSGTEKFQLSSSATDDVIVCTGNGTVELAT